MLVPPREYTLVAPDVAISSFPHARSLPFLVEQSFASALFLTPKTPLSLELDDRLRQWMLGLRFKWFETPKVKGSGKIVASQAMMRSALEWVLAAPKPMLVAGFDGIETAALLLACLRKLQCHSESSIAEELARRVKTSSDTAHIRFVSAFCAIAPPPCAAASGQTSPKTRVEPGLARQSSSPHMVDIAPILHRKDSAVTAEEDATLVLPVKPPHWLWYGHSSPAALLYGEEYDNTEGQDPQRMTWHPTMRLSYVCETATPAYERSQARPSSGLRCKPALPPQLDLDGDEHDRLSTPTATQSRQVG